MNTKAVRINQRYPATTSLEDACIVISPRQCDVRYALACRKFISADHADKLKHIGQLLLETRSIGTGRGTLFSEASPTISQSTTSLHRCTSSLNQSLCLPV